MTRGPTRAVRDLLPLGTKLFSSFLPTTKDSLQALAVFPKDWVTGTGPRYVDERLEQCIIAIIYLYKEVLNSAKKSQSWHPGNKENLLRVVWLSLSSFANNSTFFSATASFSWISVIYSQKNPVKF